MNILEVILIGIASFYLFNDLILIFAVNSIQTIRNISTEPKGLSVIIPAKNESRNLEHNLPSILNQNYSNFEVIVVNDQSTDNTSIILSKLKSVYPNLRFLDIDKDINSSKKNAISKGIKIAKYKHLLFTDADCRPLSDKWLSTIQKYYVNSDTIILGYSPYKKKLGWLNKIIRFETYQTGLNYFGYAKLGLAYMGVGRNFGYDKAVFKKVNGFKSHEHLLSGDDDLFVNKIAQKVNIELCIEPDTFVESEPKNTFKSWIEQKRRHYTTAPHYKIIHQFLLGFQFLVRFLFWFLALPAALIIAYKSTVLYSIILMSTLIIKSTLSRPVYKKFIVKDLWLESYILEFQLICLQLYIFSLNLVSSKKEW